MTFRRLSWFIFLILLPIFLVNCAGEMSTETMEEGSPDSGEEMSDSGVATVKFEYFASTSIDPQVAQQFSDCVQGVGQTHIHPSWRNFVRINMTAQGDDLWIISFDDVPTNILQRIRISDPNVCADNPTGASTDGIFANGVELTNIVDTPGSGIEPGVSFTVDPQGNVTP